MTRLRLVTIGLVIGVWLVTASAASALTLGSTATPSGATPQPCTSGTSVYIQFVTDSSYDYSVPAGGGVIDSWSTSTATGDTAGTPMTLLVLKPNSGASFTLVGLDTENLPTPLPTSGVATFNITHPISVSGGEVLGMYSPGADDCAFIGGSLAAADAITAAPSTAAPSLGTQYQAAGSLAGALLNVAVNLVQTQDVAITAAAPPSSITTGGAAAYIFALGNGGPATDPITFTDTVPGGLKILTAAAGSGSCSIAGQTVTCTITGLAAGATAPVLIMVSAAAAGSYPDTATVSTPLTDATPADNSASATLTVAAPVRPSCHVAKLVGAPLAVARAVIPDLNCTLGKVTKKSSKKIRKGLVISTSPGSGTTLANGAKVNIVVSAGPPKKKKQKKKT